MWFKVTKDFGHHKVGDKIELKENSQHKLLQDKGLIKESDAPKVEKSDAAPDTYKTDNILKEPKADKKSKEVKE